MLNLELLELPPLHFEFPALAPLSDSPRPVFSTSPMARSSTLTNLVFLDAALNTDQILIQKILPEAEVVVLDADRDGIEQITVALANRRGLQSLHIVFQGDPSSLQLGSTHLTLFSLDRYGWQLQQWGESLAANAQILLHCSETSNVGDPDMARLPMGLLNRLRLLTGARIFACGSIANCAPLQPACEPRIAVGRSRYKA